MYIYNKYTTHQTHPQKHDDCLIAKDKKKKKKHQIHPQAATSEKYMKGQLHSLKQLSIHILYILNPFWLMPAKSKLPLQLEAVLQVCFSKHSLLALDAQPSRHRSMKLYALNKGQSLFMICMMVAKGLHRMPKWSGTVALLWQPSTQLCKKRFKTINVWSRQTYILNLQLTH